MNNNNNSQSTTRGLPSPNTELHCNLYNHLYTYGLRTFMQTVVKVVTEMYPVPELDAQLARALQDVQDSISPTLAQEKHYPVDSDNGEPFI